MEIETTQDIHKLTFATIREHTFYSSIHEMYAKKNCVLNPKKASFNKFMEGGIQTTMYGKAIKVEVMNKMTKSRNCYKGCTEKTKGWVESGEGGGEERQKTVLEQ